MIVHIVIARPCIDVDDRNQNITLNYVSIFRRQLRGKGARAGLAALREGRIDEPPKQLHIVLEFKRTAAQRAAVSPGEHRRTNAIHVRDAPNVALGRAAPHADFQWIIHAIRANGAVHVFEKWKSCKKKKKMVKLQKKKNRRKKKKGGVFCGFFFSID
jgi:hypothetical protein